MLYNQLISNVYPNSKGYFSIIRKGQDEISKSDLIVVEARIFLPADDDFYLLNNVQVFNRCLIFNENLNGRWGNREEAIPNFRYKMKTFKSEKWKDAFKQAEEYCHNEIMKLENMLIERAKALLDAEIED